jgi:ABC-type polysaccharide/polyol phosphate transport system ATPase subunit
MSTGPRQAASLPDHGDRQVVVDVRNVSKRFKLYYRPFIGPLKERLIFWRKHVNYREHVAVNDASLAVRRGEIVGIIGPNGAGKTTLLKMIAGLLPVDSGSITIRGKVTALLAMGLGVHPDFTGRENIYFNGLLLGMSKEEIAAKTPSIIAFAELGEYIDQPFRTYSSGMRARLLFSISMSIDPDILIVDEALATGDMVFVRKCYQRIRELCASGATILFVTHDMHQMMGLCDQAILIMNGSVAFSGAPEDCFSKYRELYVSEANKKLVALSENEAYHLVDGDGSIRVTDIAFHDGQGKATQAFFTGGPMTIELSVEQAPECEEFYVFIGFLLGKQYVGHIDTESLSVGKDEIRNLALRASRRIALKIDSLVMLNGIYSLWILIVSVKGRRTLAEYRNVAKFMVSKRHHPFDADAFFCQPVAGVDAE